MISNCKHCLTTFQKNGSSSWICWFHMRIICRENIFWKKNQRKIFPRVYWIKLYLDYSFCANVIIKKTSASIQNVYNFGNMCKLKSIRLLKIVRVSLLLRWVEILRNCRYREHHTNITIWYVYTYRIWTYSGNCAVYTVPRDHAHIYTSTITRTTFVTFAQIRTIPCVSYEKFSCEWVKSVYTHNWNIQGKLRMGIFWRGYVLSFGVSFLVFLWSF